MQRNVTIFGAGYVGLTTGAHWSKVHNVTIFDIDEAKIQQIKEGMNGGSLPVHEPNLKETLQKNKERLTLTTSPEEALQHPDLVFLCVGTPPTKEGKASLEFIKKAAQSLAEHIKEKTIVITKSTVPPGTAYLIEETIKQHTDIPVIVASCPEFLAEGTAMKDLHSPSRIVVGCDDEPTKKVLEEFFSTLHAKEKIVMMDVVSAETTKYLANAMLASRLSFMNNAAMFCDKIGANVHSVRKALAKDPRIGENFLYPGFGYGGSCFPKDTRAIAAFARSVNVPLELVDATIDINQKVLDAFFMKIKQSYDTLQGKTFLIWGLGFKANTDDVRESQSVTLCERLLAEGAQIIVYDVVEQAVDNFLATHEGKKGTQYAVEGVDGLIIGNEAEPFRLPRADMLKNMRTRKVFDGKNCVTEMAKKELQDADIVYCGVGTDHAEKQQVLAWLKSYIES